MSALPTYCDEAGELDNEIASLRWPCGWQHETLMWLCESSEGLVHRYVVLSALAFEATNGDGEADELGAGAAANMRDATLTRMMTAVRAAASGLVECQRRLGSWAGDRGSPLPLQWCDSGNTGWMLDSDSVLADWIEAGGPREGGKLCWPHDPHGELASFATKIRERAQQRLLGLSGDGGTFSFLSALRLWDEWGLGEGAGRHGGVLVIGGRSRPWEEWKDGVPTSAPQPLAIRLALLCWRLELRPWYERMKKAKESETRRRATWKSPSLPESIIHQFSRPPKSASELTNTGSLGWCCPGMRADAMELLGYLPLQPGRAILRSLPTLARIAAITRGRSEVVHQQGDYRVTVEEMASQATLVRLSSPRAPAQALASWLGLHGDAKPLEILRLLAALSLRWQLVDAKLTGPIITDLYEPIGRGGAGGIAECRFALSAIMHPALAAKLGGSILVPCLKSLPPSWHAKVAGLCDQLDHALMRELAASPYTADSERGVRVDVDALLGELGGPRWRARGKDRRKAVARLGLDGGEGLWTSDEIKGGERRWRVTDGRLMPVDEGAAAMLREGWEIRRRAKEDGSRGGMVKRKSPRSRRSRGRRWSARGSRTRKG